MTLKHTRPQLAPRITFKVTSEAFLIQQYHEYRPNFPSLEEDDYKFAFDIENTHNAESLKQQILADMMVTLSMSVERMCQNCDVHLHSLRVLAHRIRIRPRKLIS